MIFELIIISFFAGSILVAIWINKHMAKSTRWFFLPIFVIVANEAEFKDFKVSPIFPDWLNYTLAFIFSVLCGGVILCITLEFFNVWTKISPTEKNNTSNSNYDVDFTDWRSDLKKRELITELRQKIFDMEYERSRLQTSNNGFLNDCHLTPSELDRNRERAYYLSEKIMEYSLKLQELENS